MVYMVLVLWYYSMVLYGSTYRRRHHRVGDGKLFVQGNWTKLSQNEQIFIYQNYFKMRFLYLIHFHYVNECKYLLPPTFLIVLSSIFFCDISNKSQFHLLEWHELEQLLFLMKNIVPTVIEPADIPSDSVCQKLAYWYQGMWQK